MRRAAHTRAPKQTFQKIMRTPPQRRRDRHRALASGGDRDRDSSDVSINVMPGQDLGSSHLHIAASAVCGRENGLPKPAHSSFGALGSFCHVATITCYLPHGQNSGDPPPQSMRCSFLIVPRFAKWVNFETSPRVSRPAFEAKNRGAI